MKYLLCLLALALVLYAMACTGGPDLKTFILWSVFGVMVPVAAAAGAFLGLCYWLFVICTREV